MDTLYVKTASGLEQINLGGGSSSAISITRQTTTLESALPAGTEFAVPVHETGTGKLRLYLWGILLGSDAYTETTVSSVTFSQELPAGTEVTAEALVAPTMTRTEATLAEALPAGTAYPVAQYRPGHGEVAAYSFGILLEGVTEASATSVTFASDLPAGTELTIQTINGGSE